MWVTDQAFRKEGEGVTEAVTPFLFPLYSGKVIVYSLSASCRGRVRMNIVPRTGFHQTNVITKAASPAPNPFLVPHPAFKGVSIFSRLPLAIPLRFQLSVWDGGRGAGRWTSSLRQGKKRDRCCQVGRFSISLLLLYPCPNDHLLSLLFPYQSPLPSCLRPFPPLMLPVSRLHRRSWG